MASFQLIMLLIVLHHAHAVLKDFLHALHSNFFLRFLSSTCLCHNINVNSTLFMSFCRCFICYMLLGDIERSTFKMRG
jgi:hypothetical protein